MNNFLKLPFGPNSFIHVAISNIAFIHPQPESNKVTIIFIKPLTLHNETGQSITSDRFEIEGKEQVASILDALNQ